MYATLLDDPEMINRQLGRYLAVTAADIQAVAGEVFRPDNRTVLTYMPAAETASGTASGTTDEASHGDEETAA
jgi:predicted Zn-dependent peptidase